MTAPLKTLAVPLCGALLALLTGCGGVFLREPFPAARPPVDKERLEGNWQLDDGFLAVAFDEKGVGHAATLEWKDDRFAQDEYTFVTVAGPQRRYLCAAAVTNGVADASHYLVARYEFVGSNALKLFWAQPEAFAAAVSNRVLAGTVDRGSPEKRTGLSVLLTDPPERLLKVFDAPTSTNLFADPDAKVLRKAVKQPGP